MSGESAFGVTLQHSSTVKGFVAMRTLLGLILCMELMGRLVDIQRLFVITPA